MGRGRGFDPAALVFHAVALALVAVLCVVLFLKVRSDPAPQPTKGAGLQGALDSVKNRIDGVLKQAGAPEPAKAPPVQQKAAGPRVATMVTVPGHVPLPPGRVWRYNVTLDPPQGRDAVLMYRTATTPKGTAVYTEFAHAGGKMSFELGMYAANHPSHANVRFPGFFMHTAYLDKVLEVGQRFAWEWPWQLPGGAVRAGRVKRYEGQVKGWEEVVTPGGTFIAARIDTALSYLEGGRVHAQATETLWYAPKASQVVKVIREGATPDEGAKRIVAELVALQ